jgi:hypothetical protein
MRFIQSCKKKKKLKKTPSLPIVSIQKYVSNKKNWVSVVIINYGKFDIIFIAMITFYVCIYIFVVNA